MKNIRLLLMLLALCAGVSSNSFGMKRSREVFEQGDNDKDTSDSEGLEQNLTDEGKGREKRARVLNVEEELFRACKNGFLKIAREMIEKQADVNKVHIYWGPSLTIACKYGHLKVVKLLVASGAKINLKALYKNRHEIDAPLAIACKYGRLKIVEFLIEKGADLSGGAWCEFSNSYNRPLVAACEGGNLDIVKLLINNGAKIKEEKEHEESFCTPLFAACMGGHFNVVEFLVNNGENVEDSFYGSHTPLMEACRSGNNDVVKFLIENGADANKGYYDEYTPLICLCRDNGNLDMVRFLIENGADVNKGSEDGEHTPLTMACVYGHFDIVKLLVEKGAKVDKASDKYTPLLIAIDSENENLEIIKFLIENGAKIENALFKACSDLSDCQSLSAVKKLVERKVDINAVNRQGFMALDLAVDARKYEVAMYLISLKAKCSNQYNYPSIQLWFGLQDKMNKIKKIQKIVKSNDAEFLLKVEISKLNILNKLMFLIGEWLYVYSNYINIEIKRIYTRDLKLNPEWNKSLLFQDAKKECYKELSLKKDRFIMLLDVVKETLKILFEKTGDKLNYEQTFVNSKNKKISLYPLNNMITILRFKYLPVINSIEFKKLLVKNMQDIIDLLMKNGSKIDFVDIHKKTPIFHTCFTNEMQIDTVTGAVYYGCLTKYLIKKCKAKVNLKDSLGNSPLYYATVKGNKFSIKALLQAGAETKNISNRGYDFYYELTQSKPARSKGLFVYFSKNKVLKYTFESIKDKASKRKKSLLKEDKKFKTDTCMICMDEFDNKEARSTFYMPCGHNVCLKCAKKTFIDESKLWCVMCKESNVPKDIEFEYKESKWSRFKSTFKSTLKDMGTEFFGFDEEAF